MVKEEHGDSADSISAEPMAVKAVMEFCKTDCLQRVMVTSIYVLQLTETAVKVGTKTHTHTHTHSHSHNSIYHSHTCSHSFNSIHYSHTANCFCHVLSLWTRSIRADSNWQYSIEYDIKNKNLICICSYDPLRKSSPEHNHQLLHNSVRLLIVS